MIKTVLVALSSSTYYGEDMKEIDHIEHLIRRAVDPTDSFDVHFIINNNVEPESCFVNCDAVAFYNTGFSKMEETKEMGLEVYCYQFDTDRFVRA